jgi:drug/metabolite transporter (DMT)-like permease
LLISVHWILFFYAIKISSVSITLSVLSSASLMTSFLEPIFYKRKIRGYEVFFGALVILGLGLIFRAERDSSLGNIHCSFVYIIIGFVYAAQWKINRK